MLGLDLYCCAGAASKGYTDAGYPMVGVDISPQKNYPYPFIQLDALQVLRVLIRGLSVHGYYLTDFDFIHASPPCQHDSNMTVCRPGLSETYPDLIGPTRELLQQAGLPYVIENVEGAKDKLVDPFVLCMDMFGVPEISKDRWFETSFPVLAPEHKLHKLPRMKAGRWREGYALTPVGNFPRPDLARELMGVPWMTRHEIAECIPPVYTEFIGRALAAHLLTDMGI